MYTTIIMLEIEENNAKLPINEFQLDIIRIRVAFDEKPQNFPR